MAKRLVIQPYRWFYKLRFGFNRKFIDFIKQFPGTRWDHDNKWWFVPVEFGKPIQDIAVKQFGFEKEPLPKPGNIRLAAPPIPDSKLHPWQKDSVDAALKTAAWIFNDEMGLGKTPQFIEAVRRRGDDSVVVVCPANVRLHWRDQLDSWWPDHPKAEILDTGKKAASSTAPIKIVSYGLLKHLEGRRLGSICFDEAHYLINSKAQRSKAAARLVRESKGAWRVGLTATMMTNEPTTAHNVLDTLFPGRYGTYFKFASRYSNAERGDYGWSFSGLNERHADELRGRLSWVSSRTTKKEVGHLLPPFLVSLRHVERDRIKDSAALAQESLASGASHVALLSYNIEVAHQLADACQRLGLPEVTVITGESLPAKRAKMLRRAQAADRAVVCATIDAVKEGIDLTFCTYVVIAQLYSRPATMVQVLGRFHRLSGAEPVTAIILGNKGYDKTARSLARKLKAISAVIKTGVSEDHLTEVLGQLSPELTDDEMDVVLAEILNNARMGAS